MSEEEFIKIDLLVGQGFSVRAACEGDDALRHRYQRWKKRKNRSCRWENAQKDTIEKIPEKIPEKIEDIVKLSLATVFLRRNESPAWARILVEMLKSLSPQMRDKSNVLTGEDYAKFISPFLEKKNESELPGSK